MGRVKALRSYRPRRVKKVVDPTPPRKGSSPNIPNSTSARPRASWTTIPCATSALPPGREPRRVGEGLDARSKTDGHGLRPMGQGQEGASPPTPHPSDGKVFQAPNGAVSDASRPKPRRGGEDGSDPPSRTDGQGGGSIGISGGPRRLRRGGSAIPLEVSGRPARRHHPWGQKE